MDLEADNVKAQAQCAISSDKFISQSKFNGKPEEMEARNAVAAE